MSADVVIRAEGLGKKYVIGHQAAQRERYVALRDVIARNARNLGRTAMDLVRGRPNVVGDEVEEFWALKDVSFEIRRGEVVGVIGRNGAGKSTLLKVLSRITEPTEGRVEIRGRVASLLEVGTGFHAELTGRENIYLNGAVLGMSHAEIRRKFDEIVAFAEVEKFLDTPVKRYSSGMYVRLAFAVAAHLEPEILIVDEVLAVGDAEFQKKCLGKMGEVASHGRTVLFVSHNIGAVETLCERAIMLSAGRLQFEGKAREGVTAYLRKTSAPASRRQSVSAFTGVESLSLIPDSPQVGSALSLTLLLSSSETESFSELALIIYKSTGERMAIIDGREFTTFPINVTPGKTSIDFRIGCLPLVTGRYQVGAYFRSSSVQTELPNLTEFFLGEAAERRNFVPVEPEWRGVLELSPLKTQVILTALPDVRDRVSTPHE
jgi:lipopolysaccharide transport system ATP-binding protein